MTGLYRRWRKGVELYRNTRKLIRICLATSCSNLNFLTANLRMRDTCTLLLRFLKIYSAHSCTLFFWFVRREREPFIAVVRAFYRLLLRQADNRVQKVPETRFDHILFEPMLGWKHVSALCVSALHLYCATLLTPFKYFTFLGDARGPQLPQNLLFVKTSNLRSPPKQLMILTDTII